MRPAASVLVLVAALSLPGRAGADIVPEGVRQCEDAGEGQGCLTDRCTPGVCKTTPVLCKKTRPGCLACLLARDAGDGACDEECATRAEPCVLCAPADPVSDAASRANRWSDCQSRQPGDACKTEACEDGVCGPAPCPEPPCPPATELACAVPAPEPPGWRIALGVAVAAGAALAVLVLGRLRRRRA